MQIEIWVLFRRKEILLKGKLLFLNFPCSSNSTYGREAKDEKLQIVSSLAFESQSELCNWASFSPSEDWKPLHTERDEDAQPLPLWALIYHSLLQDTSAQSVFEGMTERHLLWIQQILQLLRSPREVTARWLSMITGWQSIYHGTENLWVCWPKSLLFTPLPPL